MIKAKKNIKKRIWIGLSITIFVLLIGFLIWNQNNYTTQKQAQVLTLQKLEEKYDKKFQLCNEGELEEYGGKLVFSVTVKDTDDLRASATLTQQPKIDFIQLFSSKETPAEKSLYTYPSTTSSSTKTDALSDNYMNIFFTKKAREAIEPYFAEQPFEQYFINPVFSSLPNEDISIHNDTQVDRFHTFYELSVILEDDLSATEYAQIIHPFYEALTEKQQHNVTLSFYAKHKTIYAVSVVKTLVLDYKKSEQDILDVVTKCLADEEHPQPSYDSMRSPYYNGKE